MRPRPRPPCSTGIVRYGGIQLNKPHHANNPKRLSNSRKMVLLRRLGAKMAEKRGFSLLRDLCCFHISDSGTPLPIHNVTIAGKMPTKKTMRQLFLVQVSTVPATTAAAANPHAQVLCTRAMAFARRWV